MRKAWKAASWPRKGRSNKKRLTADKKEKVKEKRRPSLWHTQTQILACRGVFGDLRMSPKEHQHRRDPGCRTLAHVWPSLELSFHGTGPLRLGF